MARFEEYCTRYEHFQLERTPDGIVTWRFHSKGGPLTWNVRAIHDVGPCLNDIAHDRQNEVLILTGTDDQFIAGIDYRPSNPPDRTFPVPFTAHGGGTGNLDALFALHIPVIAAVNGPARVHSELAVLSDIVLASPNALFQDLPHFTSGLVPGDGINMAWQMLLGPNRARYFLWTGQEIHAEEAHQLGVVNEIVPREQLLDRAHELARLLMKQPKLVRKLTRQVLIRNLKQAHMEDNGFGGALEIMAWGYHGPPADILPEPS
jgi:enoyl-CoA hydratase/carnithine racemase